MDKKILIAVDDSIHSKNALRYVAGMSAILMDLNFTLFHVQPAISQFLLDEARISAKANSELKKIIQKNSLTARNMLETYKFQMIKMGIDEKRIELLTHPKMLGRTKDIIEHARQMLYDAIVVGRRGLSRAQKLVMGSVTTELLENSKGSPVWIVDDEVKSSKIILSVDGSESSFRAVDHLSFMVGENPDVKITLFHVIPRFTDYCEISFDKTESEIDEMDEIIIKGDKRYIDNFYAHCRRCFKKAGINEDQIEIKTAKCSVNVGKVIIDEVTKGNYGTLVIGRRGVNKSFFLGSVSRYLANKISNRALWIVS